MEKVHTIKIREDGSGYKKGDIVKATFHSCQVADNEKGEPVEFALVTLHDVCTHGRPAFMQDLGLA